MINQMKVGNAFLAMASATRANPICQNVTNILNNTEGNSGTVSISDLMDGLETLNLGQLNTTSALTTDNYPDLEFSKAISSLTKAPYNNM